MTTHHRLLATTVLTSLALLSSAPPGFAASDLVLENSPAATITTTEVYRYVNVGITSSGQSLTVSDGGNLTSEYLDIGYNFGSDNNSVTVTGANSQLYSSDGLSVGLDGNGNSLTVRDGGSLKNGTKAFLGLWESYGNHVDVIGPGSSWSIDGDLDIAPSVSPGVLAAESTEIDIPLGNYVLVKDGATVTQVGGNTTIGTLGAAVPMLVTTAEVPSGSAIRYSSLWVEGAGSSFSTNGSVIVGESGELRAGEGALIQAGSLSLTATSRLSVHVSDDAASRIEIDGAAQLNGTLLATIRGQLSRNRYTVLTANETSGDFADFIYDSDMKFVTADYDITGTTVDLLFASDLTGLDGLNENQRNTAGAIDRFFNGGGELGGGFSALFGLSEQELPRALSEMSGEVGATGGAQAAEQANTSFLTLMTRPRVDAPAGGGMAARMGDVTVLPTADAAAEGGGWSMWGAVFGGAADLPGDSDKGSHDTDTSAIGIATGWDHALSADTTLGLALAGGGTSWDLGGAMGSGDSTFLQLGANASHRMGASYLSFAGAYAWHAMSTERRVTVPASEKLEADFNTNALAGRIEGGHRFGGDHALGLTPYAALQAQAIHLPDYDEDGSLGKGSFALSYDSNTATAVRGELGLGLDATMGGARLWGRAAWAHDWNSDGNVSAAFQSLPGAGFTVNGAESPEDIALVSLGAEIGVTEAGVLAASFDGEFGEEYESYAGSLKLGFNW